MGSTEVEEEDEGQEETTGEGDDRGGRPTGFGEGTVSQLTTGGAGTALTATFEVELS